MLLAVRVCAPDIRAATAGGDEAITEYQVKAGFLFNFLAFTDFPTSRLDRAHGTIVIGFMGDPSLRQAFNPVEGKQVGDRRLVVESYESVRQIRDCHVLFIGATAGRHVQRALEKLRGTGTLTVGETADFTRAGGVIRFVKRTDAGAGGRSFRLRFEVNLDAAEREGLRFRAQFLRLAEIVRHGATK